MESRAKLFGHPIHQMLIVFPLGLLAMAVIFDIFALALAEGYWSEIAYWMIAAGVVTGLLAAPFGLIDWLAIPAGTRAKRIGAVHGLGNVVVVLLFWALHIDIDITNALAVATLPLLAGMLAPVPGGIGAREAVTVALAAATNIGAAQLLSLAVLQRVLLVGALPLALLAVRGARRAMAWRHA